MFNTSSYLKWKFIRMQCAKCGNTNTETENCTNCGSVMFTKEYCINCNKPLLFPDKPCPYCENNDESSISSSCFYCNSKLSQGFLFTNARRLDALDGLLLTGNNDYLSKDICKTCFNLLKQESAMKLEAIKKYFKKFTCQIPVLSVEKPDCFTITKYCKVITARYLVEMPDKNNFIKNLMKKAPTNEFFGEKFNVSENMCLFDLRKKALQTGANLVIGCNINYSEISTKTPAFMISMMGTGVIVEDFNILTEQEQKIFNYLFKKSLL